METAEISQSLDGDKLYQQRARVALPILVRQAKADRKIYYADLAYEIGIPNPRNLNYPLGSIGRTLKDLSEAWGENIPQIQCIVVNQSTELPGEGIGGFITDRKKFKKLNSKQKKALVNGVLADTFGYEKWDSVLSALGLQAALIDKETRKKIENTTSLKIGRGGEGEQHRKLKLYISNNPSSVGVNLKGLQAETEKGLPSGDSIDVSFENKGHWIGVEVKSASSYDFDILRGLYQCVKYQAVMESHLSVLDVEKNIRVILALGCKLPDTLVPVKNILGIEVVETIST